MVISFIRSYNKGKRHDHNIYKRNHPVTPKEVVNVFDLGYLDHEKDFPEQPYVIPYKKKVISVYHKKKSGSTKFIQKRE